MASMSSLSAINGNGGALHRFCCGIGRTTRSSKAPTVKERYKYGHFALRCNGYASLRVFWRASCVSCLVSRISYPRISYLLDKEKAANSHFGGF
ncbi:hypothetical protein OH492_02800 [Vibrio chagasii]|nr:hypothetical protein [Vibrio chagasii]